MTNSQPETGKEILDRAAAEPTLDEMMRRDPRKLTDADLDHMIKLQRIERGLFVKAKDIAKAKRRGNNVEESSDE